MAEDSLLFSLRELNGLEEERIRGEEAKTLEAARRAKEEVETRARLAEERRLREETLRREDAMRLEILRCKEVEKARVEAEAAVRAEAIRQEQARQAQTATVEESIKKTRPLAAIVFGLLSVFSIAGSGLFVHHREAWFTSELETVKSQLASANFELERARAILKDRETQMAQLESTIAHVKLPAPCSPFANPVSGKHQTASKVEKSNPPAASNACACTPGDPLCSCIP